MHFYPRILTDYEKGWAVDALPSPGPSKEFPPDRPPTEVYETWKLQAKDPIYTWKANFKGMWAPEVAPASAASAFHYPNPVTGKRSAGK